MTCLIRLYPPAWRRRYGPELAELIASQTWSFGVAIDLMAGAEVTIGGTLAPVLAWTGARARYGSNPYNETLLSVSWLVPMLFSQRYTSLKGRPGRVQAVLIAGPAAIVIAIALAAAWINTRT